MNPWSVSLKMLYFEDSYSPPQMYQSDVVLLDYDENYNIEQLDRYWTISVLVGSNNVNEGRYYFSLWWNPLNIIGYRYKK